MTACCLIKYPAEFPEAIVYIPFCPLLLLKQESIPFFGFFEENIIYFSLFLFVVMKACILYFSQTGNTRKFAEAISDSLKIPAVLDLTTTEPSAVNDYDVIMLGTPVHGFNPAIETLSFVKGLPEGNGKRAILFCTHRIWKGKTFGKLKKELKKKGYSSILCVAVKGKEFTKEMFSDSTAKIAESLKE